jgi:hypothetical protein
MRDIRTCNPSWDATHLMYVVGGQIRTRLQAIVNVYRACLHGLIAIRVTLRFESIAELDQQLLVIA